MLNSKNEDTENMLEDLIEAHRKEIDTITVNEKFNTARYHEMIEEEIQYRSQISALNKKVKEFASELYLQKEEYEKRLMAVTAVKNEMQKDLENKTEKFETSMEHMLTAKAADSLIILELRKQWTEHKCPSVEPILHEKNVLENLLSEKTHHIEQLENDFFDVKRELSAAYEEQLTRLHSELLVKKNALETTEKTVTILGERLVSAKEALNIAEKLHEEKLSLAVSDAICKVEISLTNQWEEKFKEQKVTHELDLEEVRSSLNKDRQQSETNIRQLLEKLEKQHKTFAEIKMEYESRIKQADSDLRQLRAMNSELEEKVANECNIRSAEHLKDLAESLTTLLREKLEEELSQRAERTHSSEKRLEAELARHRKLIQTTKQELEQSNEASRRKMEKSLQFTDLTAELDKKWAETVGRECARVKDEVTSKLQADFHTTRSNLEDYHTNLVAEMRDEFKQQLQLLESENSHLNNEVSKLVMELKDIKERCANLLENQLMVANDRVDAEVKLREEMLTQQDEDFTAAQNILKAKIHELHQRLIELQQARVEFRKLPSPTLRSNLLLPRLEDRRSLKPFTNFATANQKEFVCPQNLSTTNSVSGR
ncbi:hypothetical protein P879_00879 [Paragonimus westermani]|uniref:Uncharacterized protein n=1 Tax=Paragonimus westermani TaxID=34504 RepID=A0A8T0DLF0_9TREM|nr:hypothetical protein P879_00879 [Paragonimus westermani]